MLVDPSQMETQLNFFDEEVAVQACAWTQNSNVARVPIYPYIGLHVYIYVYIYMYNI